MFRLLLLALMLLGGAAFSAQPLQAQDDAPIRLDVRAGYDQHYHLNQWFPVVVTISNDGPDIQGVLEWNFPGINNSTAFQRAIDLPRGSRKSVTLSVVSDNFTRNGELRLLVGNDELLSQNVRIEPIGSEQLLVGVIGSDATLLNSLAGFELPNVDMSIEVVHLDATTLPEDAMLIEGLNVIVLYDVATADLTEGQRDALELWVRLGGELIVSGGVNADRTTAGIADLLPGEVTELVRDASLDSLPLMLGQFAQTGAFPPSATVNRVNLRSDATALDDANLVTVRDVGAGRTIFAAFDLGVLRAWNFEARFWGDIIRAERRLSPATQVRWSSSRLPNQALQLPELQLISVWMLLLFMVVYILVVGPLNFLALRRLRRVEWAWASVPAIVALFIAGTYAVSFLARGNRPQMFQVTVVQGYENARDAQATAFVGLFSPLRRTYQLTFPSGTLVDATSMRSVSSDRTPVVEFDDRIEWRDVLVDVSSLRTFTAERAIASPVQVESDVRRDQFSVSVEVRNGGDAPLEDALLVYGTSVQQLATIAPGASVQTTAQFDANTFPYAADALDEGLWDRQQVLQVLFDADSFSMMMPSAIPGMPESDGVYLLAWSDRLTLTPSIDGAPLAEQQGLTLYVIRLDG